MRTLPEHGISASTQHTQQHAKTRVRNTLMTTRNADGVRTSHAGRFGCVEWVWWESDDFSKFHRVTFMRSSMWLATRWVGWDQGDIGLGYGYFLSYVFWVW